MILSKDATAEQIKEAVEELRQKIAARKTGYSFGYGIVQTSTPPADGDAELYVQKDAAPEIPTEDPDKWTPGRKWI